MAEATGRASGKVILFGEHAVVYGVPAIAIGIDRGATATVTFAPGETSELVVSTASKDSAPKAVRTTETFPPSNTFGTTTRAGDSSDLGNAFSRVLAATNTARPVHVDARAELPAAAGLGCSAALGVAIVRALDAFAARPPASPADVAERALAWEKVFHGNPSGIDTTVASRGGFVLYQRTDGGPSVRPLRLATPLSLAIGNTGLGASTRTMVEAVARLRERSPKVVESSFDAIRAVVRNACLALEAGDARAIGQLMDMNQMLLGGLLVSTEEIETMCQIARANGALGAKLTGAGGGGCVVALSDDNPDRILDAWQKAGFGGFAARVSEEASP